MCIRDSRWAVCALWALVALRLLLPVTLESPVSLQAEEAPPIRAYHAIQQRETDDADTPVMSAPKDTPAVSIMPGEVQTATHVSGGEPVSLTRMLPWIWLTGVGCMPVSYTHLDVYKRQVSPILPKTVRQTF